MIKHILVIMNPLHFDKKSAKGNDVTNEEKRMHCAEDLSSGQYFPFHNCSSLHPTCVFRVANGDKTGFQENAARERTRVKTLRGAFLELQRSLPAVPPDTKLSKLDVLVLATTYIAHLMRSLSAADDDKLFASYGIMHPVKKWPMRSRLYAGILSNVCPIPGSTTGNTSTNVAMQLAPKDVQGTPQNITRSKERKTRMYNKILS